MLDSTGSPAEQHRRKFASVGGGEAGAESAGHASADRAGGARKNSVSSAIAILRVLAQRDRPAGVNAIARELGMAPSSCFKILRSLCSEDCVDFDDATKGYTLGTGIVMLARSALDPVCAFTTVRSGVEQVADDAAVAMGMWRVMPSHRMTLIGFVEGPGDMRVHLRIGQRLPMYLGALGRAIAAARAEPAAALREQFERLRWEDPLSFEDYRDQVLLARARGYAVDNGNFAPGVTTIGAAIADEIGVVRYGLSAIALNRQSAPLEIERIGEAVRAAAQSAQRRLFGRIGPDLAPAAIRCATLVE